MSLRPLPAMFETDPAVSELIELARESRGGTEVVVAPGPVVPVLLAAISSRSGRPLLVTTATGREAEDLTLALSDLLSPDVVAEFPAWETLPHERLSPSSDTVGRRLAVLRRLAHPELDATPLRVVVAPIRSLLQPLVAGLGEIPPLVINSGNEIPMDTIVKQLVEAAYTRTDLVEKRGQFAVRGGILDVFAPTDEHPVRIEFWGDTVEEVRWFSVADQRSLEIADGLWAPACRELLLTESVRERARLIAAAHPDLAEICGRLAEGIPAEGMEALAPVLASGMQLFVDTLPANAIVMVCDPERIRRRAHDLVATSQEFLAASWHNAAVGNVTPIDLGAAAYRDLVDVQDAALGRGIAWWTTSPFTVDEEHNSAIALDASAFDGYRGDIAAAVADIGGWLRDGWKVVVVTEGAGPAERIVETLRNEGVAATRDGEPEASVVSVITGRIEHGFLAPAAKLAVLTESDLVGARSATRDMRKLPSRRRKGVDPLTLKPGDHVVHEQHGVGTYVEMVARTVAGATREYVVLEYAAARRGQPADRLYVPTDQIDQVTRYVGGESPSINRLGGGDWQKTKGRARKAVREIAGELIRLYAARRAAPGRAFGPDTPWQRELEDAFPYHETPDQLISIQEVKADMEAAIPMDRVICGDVGYGKTEIAVRAAFKAVQDGAQVAILVPTTLLVQQHLETFSERYAPFPVKVAALSRFQSDKQTKAVLEGMTDGTIDVVIGTHRLLTPDIKFKDLGLVIVDEEQRFGVEHKEHLKALRLNVDVLTMSATPIPRTLEMAVTGIREMSTIQTPPEERHPVLTFVGPYDERQIAAAIRRELLREGQVFFVHNRVESIERVAARLSDLVPEARIRTAHGQLNEHTLEQVIVDFWDKAFDVLVCTTIVESGLDISNANTLILDRADVFGLSQLHQLRGRVGRGRERGYAYFMYPPEKPLTETAHDRLATIAAHTDLGAGMAVALKDLEIRGAGNLLGGEQSGHIAEVGFDLYLRLVGEALSEYKGEPIEVGDVKVELPLDAYVPHDFVPEERLRLEAYTRLAAARSDTEVDAVFEELTDRYGSLPKPVLTLLEVARFRVLARQAGLDEVVLAGTNIRFHPVDLAESRGLRLSRLYPGTLVKPAVRTILVPRPKTAKVGGTALVDVELLAWARDLLAAVLLDAPASPTEGLR